MPRVLIVDDHAAVRAGVRALLAGDPRIDVVGEAATGRDACARADALRPDVVILDVQLPDSSGIDVCREIVRQQTGRVLILTTYEIPENISDALDAGASGFLAKTAEAAQMIEAVSAVAAGHGYLCPTATTHVMARARLSGTAPAARTPPATDATPISELTAREREILHLVGRGMANKEIAQALSISPATVKSHLSRILHKLGVPTRTRAALIAAARPSGH